MQIMLNLDIQWEEYFLNISRPGGKRLAFLFKIPGDNGTFVMEVFRDSNITDEELHVVISLYKDGIKNGKFILEDDE
jgi:hypothetical protein